MRVTTVGALGMMAVVAVLAAGCSESSPDLGPVPSTPSPSDPASTTTATATPTTPDNPVAAYITLMTLFEGPTTVKCGPLPVRGECVKLVAKTDDSAVVELHHDTSDEIAAYALLSRDALGWQMLDYWRMMPGEVPPDWVVGAAESRR